MEYYSPERAMLNDLPTMREYSNVLPGFYVRPAVLPGRWTVSVWLPSAENSFSYREIEVSVEGLAELMKEYLTDPEGSLQKHFNFLPLPPRKTRTSEPAQTIRNSNDLFA